jgi:hypothetical protein
MIKQIFNYRWIFLVCCLPVFAAHARLDNQTDGTTDAKEVRISKKLAFDFKAQPDLAAQFNLKYAQVVLMGWAKDSVKVEAEITATGANVAEANKILERVTLRYDHTPRQLNLRLDIAQEQTVVKKDDNSLGNIMSGLVQSFSGGVAPKISGTNSLNIDQNNLKVILKVRLPQSAILAIENRYGNIELTGNFTNKVTANLFYGDFKADRLNVVQLDISYGELYARQLLKGTLHLRQGSMKLERGGEFNLYSNSATIELDSVANLWLDSRNDNVLVKKASKLNGKTHFTKLEIQQLSIESNLETQFGSLQIVRLHPSFVMLDVMARSTDIRLEQLPNDTRYDLVVRPDKWQAPDRLLHQERQPFEAAKGHMRIIWTDGSPKRSIAIENREGSLLMK